MQRAIYGGFRSVFASGLLLVACGPRLSGQLPAPCVDRAAAPARASTVRRSDSVCELGGSDALPAPAADGAIAVPANHPLISYSGRLDCTASGGPLLGFVGSSVRVRFVGTGISLKLRDFGSGTPVTTNYYDVSVDGGSPSLLQASPEQLLYPLAFGLSPGEHEVELFKRVEAAPGGKTGAGRGQILGFELQGQQLLPVSLPARRLEFVGDSITCGYGNEVSTFEPGSAPYTTKNSNGHKAYGALTASLLNAQYMAVAYSGRGISRNYADIPGEVLPELYLQSVPEEPSAAAWNPAQYTPDAVIINLGSNDFSTPGVDREAFLRGYIDFLASLRGYYPQAMLIVVIGPMLSDSHPPGEKALTSVTSDVEAALAARAQAGDTRIRVVHLPPQTGPWGEDWHPTVATHQKMADELAARLKVILGW